MVIAEYISLPTPLPLLGHLLLLSYKSLRALRVDEGGRETDEVILTARF